MQPSSFQIRTIIFYEWKHGTKTSETLQKICEVFGEDILTLRSVQNWYKKFRAGNFDLEDDFRAGRPVEVDDDQIEQILKEQPSICCQDIAEYLSCGKETVRRHLHQLGYINKLNKWVPHLMSEANKANRVFACQRLLEKEKNDPFLGRVVTCDEKWIYYDNESRGRSWTKPGQPPQKVAKRTLTNKKVLLSVWWDIQGVIFYDFLPSGKTIDADKYCEYLDRVQENLVKKRPALINRKGIIFHQDNAKPHTAKVTRAKIIELGWETMEHPPYSPDLAPSDFHLFRSLQNFLSGAKMASAEESQNEVITFLDRRDAEFWKNGFCKLTDRWKSVIANDGDYLDD